MASINKLSIRGVRSFSPEDAEQVLEFYMPLTVIVGANGCGKTTIIEALKFAVCGALPPGNKSGQAFVHDPRSIGTSTVKANIKLRLTNRAGGTMVVVRSMEVQQKKTTLTFKQLDGVLRAGGGGQQRQALSHKCTELDRQVPLMLGVSKAILENVVFCHQEEASWPLQEGAVLKKKFDDIFDSTRYTKALDVFAKLKKEYVITAKDYKAVVAELKSHRHAANQFQRDVDKYNDQMESLEEDLKNSRDAMRENEQEVKRIQAVIDQVEDLVADKEAKQAELLTCESVLSKQRSMLQEDMTEQHSLQELTDMLRSFDTQVDEHLGRKRDLEREMAELQAQVNRYRQQRSDLQAKVGRLQAERDAHQRNLLTRYERMVELGHTYGLDYVVTQASQSSQLTGFGGGESDMRESSFLSLGDASAVGGAASAEQQDPILDIPKEHMDEYFRAVSRKEEELRRQVADQKARQREQEDQLQKELSELMGRLKTIESNKNRIHKEEAAARNELDDIRKQSQKAPRLRKANLEDAKVSAAKAAKQRDEANADPRRKAIPIELASLDNKIDDVKAKIERDKVVQQDLRRTAETQNAIQVMKDQCAKELDILQEDIQEFNFQFQLSRVTPPPKELPTANDDQRGDGLKKIMEKIHDDVEGKLRGKEAELEKYNDAVRRLEQVVSEKSALLKHDQQTLMSKRPRFVQLDASVGKARQVVAEMRQVEPRLLGFQTPTAISETKPQDLLNYLTKRLEEIEGQSTEGIGSDDLKKIMLKLFHQAELQDERYECPCCKRLLIDDSELETYRNALKFLGSENSPLIKTDGKIIEARGKYKEWCAIIKDISNDVLEYLRLKVELEEVERHAKELDLHLVDSKRELVDAQEIVTSIQGETNDAKDFFDASKRWVDTSVRIAMQREQVNQKEYDSRHMTGDRDGRDLKQVDKDLEDLSQKKDEFADKKNQLNTEMSAINDRVASFSQTATRLETQLRNMEAKYEEELKLEERKNDLSKKYAEFKEEQEKLSEQIAPLNHRVDMKEKEKIRMRNLAEEEEKSITDTLNSFNGGVRSLREIVHSIDEYNIASNSGDAADRFEKESEELAKKANEKANEYASLKPSLERLTKMVDDQELQKKNLEENIELIQSKQHTAVLNEDIRGLTEKISSVEGRATSDKDMQRLLKRQLELTAEKARYEGRRGEIIESIHGLKRKLSQPEYRQVNEEYRVASIKHDTTETAVKDIERYHTALDRALQRYHSIKIGEINGIIRDLWTLTYKGEDITNIQIVSGEESGSRATRSYNYRVVMSKGGAQMDMRGRCSAGQRVLASIVIRLALAETFCVNFGCIALDEPTVNLDYNNKRGLAIALAQIIASRSQQSNFQLILITHDEDFVVMMKRELSSHAHVSMPEKYFQVRREEGADGKFYSKIDAIDWEELL